MPHNRLYGKSRGGRSPQHIISVTECLLVLLKQSIGQLCKSGVSRCGLIRIFLTIFQSMIYNN